MEKRMLKFISLAIGILLISASMAFAVGGIVGTNHDLSSTANGPTYGNTTETRICIFCHAPHHTITPEAADAAGLTYYPLWNHAVTTATGYRMYQNTDPANPVIPNSIQHQLNAGFEGHIVGQPGSVSKLCLSCHDGTVAINAYGFAPSSSIGTGTIKLDSASNFGIGAAIVDGQNDLSNHHPIGFDYGAVAIQDDEIRGVDQPVGGTGLVIGDLLYGGMMECGTCHDVHNTKNLGEKFLWVSDSGSRLCLTCHAK